MGEAGDVVLEESHADATRRSSGAAACLEDPHRVGRVAGDGRTAAPWGPDDEAADLAVDGHHLRALR
jgi:hypothetical protein